MPYPGGKAGAGVFHRIINLMPPHQVYIEPFLGDAAVMRAKRPAALNIGLDLDPESPGLAWLASLAGNGGGIQNPRSHNALSGEAYRRPSPVRTLKASSGGSGGGVLQVDRPSLSPAMSADSARIGEPGSAWRSPIAGNGDTADFRPGCLDGIEFLRVYPFTGRELVYCDPPYLMSTRSGRRFYKHEMADVDHRRLLRAVRALPCPVLISGYWSKLYVEALDGWRSIHFEAMTRGGHTATEWLWFNFPEPLTLHDDRFLGEGFRKREQLKRKKLRWVARLRAMPLLDRQALLSAIASIDK